MSLACCGHCSLHPMGNRVGIPLPDGAGSWRSFFLVSIDDCLKGVTAGRIPTYRECVQRRPVASAAAGGPMSIRLVRRCGAVAVWPPRRSWDPAAAKGGRGQTSHQPILVARPPCQRLMTHRQLPKPGRPRQRRHSRRTQSLVLSCSLHSNRFPQVAWTCYRQSGSCSRSAVHGGRSEPTSTLRQFSR